MPRKA
ncbi:hypothetical protein CFC21_052298, partial [Triticum aestivum]